MNRANAKLRLQKKIRYICNCVIIGVPLILGLCYIFGIIIHKYIEKPILKARLQLKIFVLWMALGYFCVYYAALSANEENVINKSQFSKFL